MLLKINIIFSSLGDEFYLGKLIYSTVNLRYFNFISLGGSKQIRTVDLGVMSPSLCQLSYTTKLDSHSTG